MFSKLNCIKVVLISLLVTSLFLLILLGGLQMRLFRPESAHRVPPSSFDQSSLIGEWIAHCGMGRDRIIISQDTYRQVFISDSKYNYQYESNENPWRIEKYEDGRIRLFLHGGVYYYDGIPSFSENEQKIVLFDPIAYEFVNSIHDLILNIRQDRYGNIVLTHLWPNSDGGYAILTTRPCEFRKGID